jgi:hypothetical protein
MPPTRADDSADSFEEMAPPGPASGPPPEAPSPGPTTWAPLQDPAQPLTVEPPLQVVGRRCLLVAASCYAQRRSQIANAIGRCTGRSVISGARLWFQTLQAAGDDPIVAQLAWPVRLLEAMSDDAFLCLVPSDHNRLGRGLGLSLAVALLHPCEVALLAPDWHLWPLSRVTIRPGRIPGSGSIASVIWHPGPPPSPYRLLELLEGYNPPPICAHATGGREGLIAIETPPLSQVVF